VRSKGLRPATLEKVREKDQSCTRSSSELCPVKSDHAEERGVSMDTVHGFP
jgi:hypothetical protein